MLERQQVIQLTQDIFQYYNGRINPNFPARLDINLIETKQTRISGTFNYPDIVTVYPFYICYNHDNNDLAEEIRLYLILETIIHELHHCEQLNAWRISSNREEEKQRALLLEKNVRYMTNTYILSHRKEILNRFHINIPTDKFFHKSIRRNSVESLYRRKTFIDHFHGFIQHIFSQATERIDIIPNIINTLLRYETDEESVIVIYINDEIVPIKYKDNWLDLKDFNDSVYNLYFKYNYFKKVRYGIKEDKDSNSVVIYLYADLYHTIARKIQS